MSTPEFGAVVDENLKVTPESPWLGLLPFTEEWREYFYGRDQEVEKLYERVLHSPLTLLYGKSGLGKTSILQAGLIPRLREHGYHPVFVRLVHETGAPSLEEQVVAALSAAAGPKKTAHEAEPAGHPGLWELFHDPVFGFVGGAATEVLRPVLILDQFEEIFTLGQDKRPTDAEAFLEALACLVENRPPVMIRAALESDDTLAHRLVLSAQPCKVLLTLRQDFLHALERWRRQMPSMMENRLELLHLSGPEAFRAVYEPGLLRTHGPNALPPIVSRETARAIVRFVAGAPLDKPLDEIQNVPPLLSLVCEQLNGFRLRQGASTIESETLELSAPEVLSNFYVDAFAGHPPAVREFVERKLISESGFRESVTLDTAGADLRRAGVTEPESHLRALVNRRVLVVEDRGGVSRVELTHDILAPIAAAARAHSLGEEAKRAADEQKARDRRNVVRAWRLSGTFAVVALLAVAASLFALMKQNEARQQTHLAQWQRARAEEQAIVATREKAAADRQKTRAEEQTALAEKEKAAAERQKGIAERNLRSAGKTAFEASVALRSRGEKQLSEMVLANALQADRDNRLLAALFIDSIVETPKTLLDSRTRVFPGKLPAGTPFKYDGTKLCTINSEQGQLQFFDLTLSKAPDSVPTGQTDISIFRFFMSATVDWIAGTTDGAVIIQRKNSMVPEFLPADGEGTDAVLDVALAPDGAQLWTIQKSGKICHRNLSSGKLTSPPVQVGNTPLRSARFSGASRTLACLDETGVFGPATAGGRVTRTIESVSDQIQDACFARGGETLAIRIVANNTASLYLITNFESPKSDLPVAYPTAEVVALSPDGSIVWARQANGTMVGITATPEALTIKTNRNYKTLNFGLHEQLAITPDGLSIYASSTSRDLKSRLTATLQRWRVWPPEIEATGEIPGFREIVDDLPFAESRITALKIDPQGRWLACACEDGKVVLTPTVATPIRPVPLYFEGKPPTRISWAGDMLVYAYEKDFRICDVKSAKVQRHLALPFPADEMAISRDGNFTAISSGGEEVVLIENRTGKQILHYKLPEEPDRENISSIGIEPELGILYVSLGRQIRTISFRSQTEAGPRYNVPVTIDKFDCDMAAKHIWVTAPKRLFVFDRASGKLLLDHEDENLGEIAQVAIDSKKGLCAVLSKNEKLMLFNVRDDGGRWQFDAGKSVPAGTDSGNLGFLTTGELLLMSRNLPGTLVVYEAENLKPLDLFEGLYHVGTFLLLKGRKLAPITIAGRSAEWEGNFNSDGSFAWMNLGETPILGVLEDPVPEWFLKLVQLVAGQAGLDKSESERSVENRRNVLNDLRSEKNQAPNSYYGKVLEWMLGDPRTRTISPSFELPVCDLVARMARHAFQIDVTKMTKGDIEILKSIADQIQAQDACHPLTHLVMARLCEVSARHQRFGERRPASTASQNAASLRAFSVNLFKDPITMDTYGKELVIEYCRIAIESLTLDSERGTRDTLKQVLRKLEQ